MKITDETFHARIQGVQQFLEEEDLGALFAYSPAMEHMWGADGPRRLPLPAPAAP